VAGQGKLAELTTRLQAAPPDAPTLRRIVAASDPAEIEAIRAAAERVLLENRGDVVHRRGLVEFSNRCVCDCRYCGIRRGNRALARYTLSIDAIVERARWCAQAGYGSLVLQSGERRDTRFVRLVGDAVRAIKDATRSTTLPEGLGITLSVGEQSAKTYAAWYGAGAHRYLLRIETSSPEHFARLHPACQSYAARVDCLRTLKAIGYRVGSGVLIGFPGQSVDDLVDDLLFLRDVGVDMIGMGPYIPHPAAPLSAIDDNALPDQQTRLQRALNMVAAARLLLPKINIAATTALQTLAPDGRERALRYGANVVMPQATPSEVRGLYTLYSGKPCVDDGLNECAGCLERRVAAVGRRLTRDAWGDATSSGQSEQRRGG
jgi:biotin synthase